MSPSAEPYITPEEYLARERHAETRSEYLDGKIYAMAGASENHIAIHFNLNAIFHAIRDKTGCRSYPSDMRVHIPATGLYTYPDLVTVCDEPQIEHAYGATLLNPLLIVEILSPSTESYDRGAKFQHYQTLASLQEYVLISQDKCFVECYVRQANETWVYHTFRTPDVALTLSSVNAQIPLSAIYQDVAFPESSDAAENREQ